MTKEEFIAKRGKEAYERYQQQCKNWSKTHKGKYTEQRKNYYQNNKEQIKANAKNYAATVDKEVRRNYKNTYIKERLENDPIFKLKYLINAKKRTEKCVSPDEAMTLLVKEAEECGCPELLNIDYMMERFNINCKYDLIYGNLEILKYFYKLMQIKVAKNEDFTENDKILLQYFRNCKVGKINSGVIRFNNGWVIDVANIDMVYVEDMIRNIKGFDLLLSEEKYLEMKGLTTEE